jgi:hypothetical protein
MKDTQLAAPTPVQAQITPTDHQVLAPAQVPTPSSIYPEVTRGIGAQAPASILMPQGEPLPGPKLVQKTSPKVTTVKIVAGIIILLNAINFYDWLLELHAGYTNWISVFEIIVIIVLAVGIFRLSEAARSIYVIVSAISLVLTCIGLITFYVSMHHVEATLGGQTVTRARLESNISFIEKDKGLSVQTKQEEIQQIQKQMNSTAASQTDVQLKQYFSTAVLILTAVGPLVFFTRPSIEEVFK